LTPGKDAVLGPQVGEVSPFFLVVVALSAKRRDVPLEVVAAQNRLSGEGTKLAPFFLFLKIF
jgi:hypothetical protein